MRLHAFNHLPAPHCPCATCREVGAIAAGLYLRDRAINPADVKSWYRPFLERFKDVERYERSRQPMRPSPAPEVVA